MKFLTENHKIEKPCVVTVGMFDGVHVGHMALIGRLKELAGSAKTLIFTFRMPDESASLYTADEKRNLLAKTRADYAFMQEYSSNFQNTEREEFLLLLKTKYNMKALVAGEDFRFGKGAKGDAGYLVKNASQMGIKVEIVPPVLMDGEKVSSTRIRASIAAGNVKKAALLLGKPYFISGTAQKSSCGDGQFTLFTSKMTPPSGIYATLTEADEKMHRSLTRILGPEIETHLLDPECGLHSENRVVFFIDSIRNEEALRSCTERTAFTEQDIETAKSILSNKNIYKPE